VRFDGAVQVIKPWLSGPAASESGSSQLWSHRCGWDELAEDSSGFDQARG
jgi:hypothetical protein